MCQRIVAGWFPSASQRDSSPTRTGTSCLTAHSRLNKKPSGSNPTDRATAPITGLLCCCCTAVSHCLAGSPASYKTSGADRASVPRRPPSFDTAGRGSPASVLCRSVSCCAAALTPRFRGAGSHHMRGVASCLLLAYDCKRRARRYRVLLIAV